MASQSLRWSLGSVGPLKEEGIQTSTLAPQPSLHPQDTPPAPASLKPLKARIRDTLAGPDHGS